MCGLFFSWGNCWGLCGHIMPIVMIQVGWELLSGKEEYLSLKKLTKVQESIQTKAPSLITMWCSLLIQVMHESQDGSKKNRRYK